MPKQELADKIMPFGDHLEELRRRVMLALYAVIPILAISLYFGVPMMNLLVQPFEQALRDVGEDGRLQVTAPLEMFAAYFKVSLVMTLLAGAPWILYQLWLFVAPGLYAHERRFAYLLAPMSAVLTACSAVFMYKVMLPVVLAFFVGFNTTLKSSPPPSAPLPEGLVLPRVPVLAAEPPAPQVGEYWYNTKLHQYRVCVPNKDGVPEVRGVTLVAATLVDQQFRVRETLDMVLTFAVAFAIAFQTPVVVLLLGWAGIVSVEFLGKYRKHAIMICAVLGSVLTPADPVSMFVLAIPLYLLFELGIVMLRLLPAERVAGGLRGARMKSKDGEADAETYAGPDA